MIKARFFAVVACGVVGVALGRGPLAAPSPSGRTQACLEQRGAAVATARDGRAIPVGRATADTGRDSPIEPRSERYDAAAAARLDSSTPADLWEREARDELFAIPREQFFRGRFAQLLRQLVPSASLDGVECRRGTCAFEVSAAVADATQLDAVLGFIPFGDVFVTERLDGDPARASVRVHVSFTREHMDRAVFEASFEKWWAERWRLARERYERDLAAQSTSADGGVP